ncbi:MAG: histidine phosphatase family protein [Candidatus Micrarchaeota archaeon]|nr:histidine phosphatase family protein [Candidatus Micrarchaeota archaeon]
MAIVIFVRHGQSETNANRVLSSSLEGYPLTPLGVLQAEHVALQLQKIEKPGHFFSSPIQRAIETAKIISRAIGEKPTLDGRIRERGFGSFEGRKFESKPVMRAFTDEEIRSNYSRGMESWDSLKGRMKNFMESLPDGVSLAISHYDPIRAAVAVIDKKYDDDLMPNAQAPIPNSSITALDVEGRKIIQMGKETVDGDLLFSM